VLDPDLSCEQPPQWRLLMTEEGRAVSWEEDPTLWLQTCFSRQPVAHLAQQQASLAEVVACLPSFGFLASRINSEAVQQTERILLPMPSVSGACL